MTSAPYHVAIVDSNRMNLDFYDFWRNMRFWNSNVVSIKTKIVFVNVS